MLYEKNIICLLLLVCITLPIRANEYTHFFRHYEVKDGLSDNLVTSCVQDKYGFIWIGTRDGLNKFDGYTFKVYRNDSEKNKSLGNNWIHHLICDKNNDLWISTNSGIFKYDEKEDAFEMLPSTQKKHISNFQFDSENNLWRLENGKLVREDILNASYKIYDRGNNLNYVAFCITPDDKVWGSDSGGYISLLDPKSGERTSYDMFSHSSTQSSKIIHQIIPSGYTSEIYMAHKSNYLKVFNTSTLVYEDIDLQNINQSPVLINCILEANENEIWIGTDSGILIYNRNTGKWTNILHNPLDPYTISSHYNSIIYKDRENGIWVGQHQNGLSYYSPFSPFSVYYPKGDQKTSFGGVIHDICIDNYNTIWIGTEDAGVSSYDKLTKEFLHFLPDPGSKNVAHTNIRGLAITGDKLWVGHIIHGVDLIDVKTRKLLKNYDLHKDNATKVNSSANTMIVTEGGDVLVATVDGIYKYNPASDIFLRISDQYAFLLYEDSQNRIWTGKNYSVPITSGDKHLTFQESDLPKVSSTGEIYSIIDIHEDKAGNFWYATNNGLLKYNMLTDSALWFTTKNGMPSNVTFRILQDDNENLWISTAAGLVCLDIGSNAITCFTEAHGLITRQFNYYASLKDKDGSLYFGTVKGFVHFDPRDVISPKDNTDVYITAIDISDNRGSDAYKLNAYPLSEVQNIKLNYNQSTFSINFSTLSYIAPGSTQYAYRIIGIDKEWNVIKSRNTVYFTNLHPGKYTLEIKASDLYGSWLNSIPLKVNIVIKPPWWSSFQAYAAYIIIFLLSIYLCIKLWLVRQKKTMAYEMQLFENKKERELFQVKFDFFINIAHDIRTTLTLINTPLERIIKNEIVSERVMASLLLMKKKSLRLIELVNQLLDFRKAETENNNLRFVNVEIVSLLTVTADFFQDEAQKNNLQLKIESPVKKLYAFIDKEAITKVLSNLFSNAVKYAKSSVVVKIHNENTEAVIVDFINDGKPISKEHWRKIFEPYSQVNENGLKTGAGLGLSIVYFLVEKHNGKIEIIESSAEKTIFRIILPVNQSKPIKSIPDDSTGKPIRQRYSFNTDCSSILIVEDNEEMRIIIADELRDNYNVFVVGSGKEALEILKDNNINLIICDILMPVMDGFEMLIEVKANPEFSHIPVIILTSGASVQARLYGLELGADAYIVKPFSMDLLLVQISNLLANRENIRKFYFVSPMANMKSTVYSKADEEFLERLNTIINTHMNDVGFDVNAIANILCMSRPTLYRKITSISNSTPHELIRTARLKKAAELLLQGNMKIYEIAEAVGFSSQSYFWVAFIKQFGMSPSKYAKANKSGKQIDS